MKLGKAFSDSIVLEKKRESRLSREADDSWWLGMGRILIFLTLVCVSFFALLWRLFDLTVIQGHRFRLLADTNRTRELIRHAPRGLLLDRTGKPLTRNVPEYRLNSPCGGKSSETLCTQRLSEAEGTLLKQKVLPPGTFLEIDYRREYLFPESTAHVVGYVGELSGNELTDEYYALRSYHPGDRVGRTGAEVAFEERLRGRDGKELVEVDAAGAVIRVLGVDPEVPGEDVALSLDVSVSQAASTAFPAGQKGAVIVSKPQTGEILALFSSPSFSPNQFTGGMTQAEYRSLVDNPDRPLFNRAIGGVYPPGSTFKIVTGLAALEEGVITSSTTVEDSGILKIGPFSFANWYYSQYGKTEGMVDIVKAYQRSNDIFFYKVGEWLGITKLAKWARIVGIGRPLGIELPGEASGLMPDPAWKDLHFSSEEDKRLRNNAWYVGDTYHAAIGQGYVLTTPLQVNGWTNVIATDGKLCKPTIEKRKTCKDLGIQKETIDLITEGMKRACSAGGTGWPLFDFKVESRKSKVENGKNVSASTSSTVNREPLTPVPVACKTGTAEFGDPRDRTHAWFTVFAPLPAVASAKEGVRSIDSRNQTVISGDPEISVTVLVEGAGEGSNVAAPVAKKILEEWFGR